MSWDLPPLRAGRPAPNSLLARREELARRQPDLATTTLPTEERTIGDVPCLVVTPPAWHCEILYLHGGGYRLGEPVGWLPLATRLARSVGARITLPAYRLAPEHPFPAAVHDVLTVFEQLRKATSRPLVAAGDSAGGGLAAALACACGARGSSGPDALVLLSPWLDLTLRGETHSLRAESDLLFPPSSSTEAADTYLQGHPSDDPLASPAFADVDGFPPTLLMAGSEETLLSDSLDFANRLALARVAVTLHVGAGMQHAWPVVFPDLPQTDAALDTVAAFVDSLLTQHDTDRATAASSPT